MAGHQTEGAAQRVAGWSRRTPWWLPPHSRSQRGPRRGHRRRHQGSHAAAAHLARRQGAAPGPPHRQTVALEPLAQGRQSQEALRVHLRPPQRAGTRPAQGRPSLVGRARFASRRRGEPAAQTRQLRLEPGAGLQRIRAHDRPQVAREATHRTVAQRTDHHRDLRRHVGARQEVGAPQTTRWPWQRWRVSVWSS